MKRKVNSISPASGLRTIDRPSRDRISADSIDQVFAEIGQKLRDGLSSEAESILLATLTDYSHTPDDLATLKRLLSFTLETVGRYQESLDAVKPFENEENLQRLKTETQVRVTTQLAIAFNNLNDHPKAVTLLKENLEKARESELFHLSGSIDIGLAPGDVLLDIHGTYDVTYVGDADTIGSTARGHEY